MRRHLPPERVAAAIGSVLVLAVFLGLVLHAGCAASSRSPRAARARRVIADFESAPAAGGEARYGVLSPSCWVRHAGTVSVRRVALPGAETGYGVLHLGYAFGDEDPAEAGFRIDLDELDASSYDQIVFWVKGDEREGFGDAFRVGFKRPRGGGSNLIETGSQVVTGVTARWQRIAIPLARMTGIRQWTRLSQFFISFHSRRSKVRRGAYYIDDVALLDTGTARAGAATPAFASEKKAWEEARGGREAAKPALRARLSGWPTRLVEPRAALPEGDREFLLRVARDTWRGLDALTDAEHALPIDSVRFDGRSTSLPGARIGDYASTTDIGMRLLGIVAAREIGLLSHEQALRRIRATLATLGRLQTYGGFFYNYYDTATLERTSNFVSFVDSSWLTAGLIVVRAAFPELEQRCTALIESGDYGFFYDDVARLMSHGYDVGLATPSEYHYGVLYSEARVGSLIAIGKGDVPEEHWFEMTRTFPPECRWQSMPPLGRRTKTVRGYEVTGGYYEWEGLRYVPSWGGSMFEALMPTLVLDEQRWAPHSLGTNDTVHATVQRRYAREKLLYPSWGLSPSSSPFGGYDEYGVAVLGVRGYHAGAVTPHAMALTLAVAPDEAIGGLRRLAQRYDIYGDYGFYDAVDLLSGRVAYAYLALDQSMILVAIANYLEPHCIQRYFASDPLIRRALPVIASEDFFP